MKVYKGQPIRYIQEKMNGMSVTIERTLLDYRVLTKTPGIDLAEQMPPHLHALIKKLPGGTTIMAELYWDGHSTAIKTKLKERSPELKLSAFALPSAPEVTLEEAMFRCQRWGVWTAKIWKIYNQLTVVDRQQWLEQAEHNELEGFVLKESHMGEWYKLKPVKEVDCVVMSTKKSWATTTFGDLKAIVVGVYIDGNLKEIASVGSGFTQKYRASVDRQTLIGRVCEVEYQDLAQQGRLLFPRFVRWRDDKPARECVF